MSSPADLRGRLAYPDDHLEGRIDPERMVRAGRRVRRNRRIAATAVTAALVVAGGVVGLELSRPDSPPVITTAAPPPYVPETAAPGAVVSARVVRDAIRRTQREGTAEVYEVHSDSVTPKGSIRFGVWDLTAARGQYGFVKTHHRGDLSKVQRGYAVKDGYFYTDASVDRGNEGVKLLGGEDGPARGWYKERYDFRDFRAMGLSSEAPRGFLDEVLRWVPEQAETTRYLGTEVPANKQLNVVDSDHRGIEWRASGRALPPTLEGVPLQHYRLTVPARDTDPSRQVVGTTAVDVWVDDRGRAVGVGLDVQAYTSLDVEETSDGRVRLRDELDRPPTIERSRYWLSGFGTPMQFNLPPERRVTDRTAELEAERDEAERMLNAPTTVASPVLCLRCGPRRKGNDRNPEGVCPWISGSLARPFSVARPRVRLAHVLEAERHALAAWRTTT